MTEYFSKAVRILQQGGNTHIRCIEGICYGAAENRSRGNYYTYVGSDFWEEISGWEHTHIALLSVFLAHAQNGLDEAKTSAKTIIIQFLIEAGISSDGQINWDKLVQYVNGEA